MQIQMLWPHFNCPVGIYAWWLLGSRQSIFIITDRAQHC